MKFLAGMGIFATLAILSSFILPWWGFVLIAMGIGAALNLHGGLSFLCGFLTMALVWGIHTWLIDSANGGQLSAKMASLLQFGSATTLWWITLLIGGLLGGLGMLTGKFGRDMVLGASAGKARYKSSKYRY